MNVEKEKNSFSPMFSYVRSTNTFPKQSCSSIELLNYPNKEIIKPEFEFLCPMYCKQIKKIIIISISTPKVTHIYAWDIPWGHVLNLMGARKKENFFYLEKNHLLSDIFLKITKD